MKCLKTTVQLLFISLAFCTCEEDGIIRSTFVDPRDGKSYDVIKVGNTTWMAEDLNFNDSTVFSYQQSLDICPPGWSMPTEEDWVKLCKYFGGYVYDQQDIGDPRKAHDRMLKDFNAQEYGSYWTSTPAWIDAASIRSGTFRFTDEIVEYGALLVTFKLPCRCVKKKKEETADIIEFTINDGSKQRYDFYSFQRPESTDESYFIVHKKVEGNVLADRVILAAKLPAQMIKEGDQPIEAIEAHVDYLFNDKGNFQSTGWTLSTNLDLKLNFTFFNDNKVKGNFSGTTYEGMVIEDGYFELTLNPY